MNFFSGKTRKIITIVIVVIVVLALIAPAVASMF